MPDLVGAGQSIRYYRAALASGCVNKGDLEIKLVHVVRGRRLYCCVQLYTVAFIFWGKMLPLLKSSPHSMTVKIIVYFQKCANHEQMP